MTCSGLKSWATIDEGPTVLTEQTLRAGIEAIRASTARPQQLLLHSDAYKAYWYSRDRHWMLKGFPPIVLFPRVADLEARWQKLRRTIRNYRFRVRYAWGVIRHGDYDN